MATIETAPKGAKSKRQTTHIDMTPMVDLGFLLITFFMLSTTFSEPKMMSLVMPEKDDGTSESKISNTLTLILAENDRLLWHQDVDKDLQQSSIKESNYSKEGIRALIWEKQKKAKNPENFTVVVKPSDKARYQNVVDVLDELAITQTEHHAITELSIIEKSLLK